MFSSLTTHNSPSGFISRIGIATTIAAGSTTYSVTTNQAVLPGDGLILFVSNKGVVVWSSMIGPLDTNNQYTMSGQDNTGSLGAPNYVSRSVNSAAAHLASWHRVPVGIASGATFSVTINAGGGSIFSIYRLVGNSTISSSQQWQATLTGGNVIAVDTINRNDPLISGGRSGYRRNLNFLQLNTNPTNNCFQNGVGANFSLLTAQSVTGVALTQNAQKYDLNYVPNGIQVLTRHASTSFQAWTNCIFIS